jgi:hypothetical protein
MSSSNGGERRVDELVVVRGEDEINQALTGHGGQSYESPPQTREQALTLLQVLLGYTGEKLNGCERWSCPVAGGRRTVWFVPQRGSSDSTHR